MRRLSLSKKIYCLFGVLGAIAVAVAVIGIVKMAAINNQLNFIVDNSAASVNLAMGVNGAMVNVSRAEKNLILASDDEDMQKYITFMKEQSQAATERMQQLYGLSTKDEQKELDQAKALWQQYLQVNQEVVRYALMNSNVKAKRLSAGKGREAFDKAEATMNLFADVEAQTNEAVASAGKDEKSRAFIATRLLKDMLAIHRTEKQMILETDNEVMRKLQKQITASKASIDGLLGKLESVIQGKEASTLKEFKQAWTDFTAVDDQVQKETLENGNQIAFDLSAGKGRQLSDQAQAVMKKIQESNEKKMAEAKLTSDKAYDAARLLMILFSAIGIVGSLALAAFLMSTINRRLRYITTSLSDGATQTSAAAGQVSAASQQLADGASEQASSLEETSSSLEEITSMAKQNTDNANRAKVLTDESAEVVTQANRSMTDLNRSMGEISESGQQIGKIIKTIDEIAFQTNLLALNAAVEAARAGEAGAGFAVVANEVRNLAMRAAEAAKNTSDLIEGTTQKITYGASLVSQTTQAFGSVATSTQKVVELVGEIAAASAEQTQGIEQINTAMAQVDKVTQQIAANAEESAAASEELNAQAETLNWW